VPIAKDLFVYWIASNWPWRIIMSDRRIFTGTTMSESTRDQVALSIWFAVLAGALFLTREQSILTTAGLMLELTAAYSTFVVCGKPERSRLVHCTPYAFVLTGAIFLDLAPDFQNAIQAGLAFAAVTALMHGSVVYGIRKSARQTDEPAYATAA
jgi:hypothetical protein